MRKRYRDIVFLCRLASNLTRQIIGVFFLRDREMINMTLIFEKRNPFFWKRFSEIDRHIIVSIM